MAYDIEEQEQLAALQAWWLKYREWILGGLTIVLVVIAAYNGWQWWQTQQTAKAAALYEKVTIALSLQNSQVVKEATSTLLSKYPRTPYSPRAALIAAKVYADTNDLKSARAQLQWVLEKSKDESLRALAALRLSAILLDEKAYDDALHLVSQETLKKAGKSFEALFADRRGDILFALNRPAEARAAYEQALNVMQPEHPLRSLVQLKRDAIPT